MCLAGSAETDEPELIVAWYMVVGYCSNSHMVVLLVLNPLTFFFLSLLCRFKLYIRRFYCTTRSGRMKKNALEMYRFYCSLKTCNMQSGVIGFYVSNILRDICF